MSLVIFRTLGEVMNCKPETQWLPWVISLRPTGLGKGNLRARVTVRLREVESFSPDPRALAVRSSDSKTTHFQVPQSLSLPALLPGCLNYTHKQGRKRNPHSVGPGLGAKLVLSWMLSSKSSMRWRRLFNSSCDGNAALIYIHKLEMKSYTIPSH